MATARKLPSGSWRVRIYVGKEEGKPQYMSFTGDTKKSAELMAATYMLENRRKPDDLSFGDAVRRYIDSKSNVLKPSTIAGYNVIYRNYIEGLKDIRLSKLTQEHLQRQLNVLASDHSPKTVNNCKGLITSVLEMFAPGFHPTLKTPARIKTEKHIPTDEDIHALLATVKGTDIELPVKLAAFGSLRRAEISGLFPDCVFEDHISIRRTFDLSTDNKWIRMNSPKSSAGYRDVPLPASIMKDLHEYMKANDVSNNTFGIFDLNPRQIYGRIQSAWKRSGTAKFGVHALRHYFATFMHENGVPDKYIAEIGGWENIETLQKIYQHTTKKTLSFAAEKMDQQYRMIEDF